MKWSEAEGKSEALKIKQTKRLTLFFFFYLHNVRKTSFKNLKQKIKILNWHWAKLFSLFLFSLLAQTRAIALQLLLQHFTAVFFIWTTPL